MISRSTKRTLKVDYWTRRSNRRSYRREYGLVDLLVGRPNSRRTSESIWIKMAMKRAVVDVAMKPKARCNNQLTKSSSPSSKRRHHAQQSAHTKARDIWARNLLFILSRRERIDILLTWRMPWWGW